IMCSDSPRREAMESSSDSDEELPVFDFLQTRPSNGAASQRSPKNPGPVSPSPRGAAGSTDVMMISSDSEDDAPYVPLAQRLMLRQGGGVLGDRNATEAPRRKGPPEPEHQLVLRQEGRTSPQEVDDLPLRPLSAPQRADSSPSRTKATKRTVEEIQASREEAQRRRQARERQQQAERKALAEAAKALRPEECIKHMVVAVDPALLQLEGGGTLLASVQALGCSCAIEKQPLPRSVTWARRAPGAQPNEAACAPEPHVVMQMTVEDFITLSSSTLPWKRLSLSARLTQEERHSGSEHSPTLTSWVQGQQRRHPSRTLSLAVVELENYFRGSKSQSQRRFREAVAGQETGGGKEKKRRRNGHTEKLPEVSRVDVEEVGRSAASPYREEHTVDHETISEAVTSQKCFLKANNLPVRSQAYSRCRTENEKLSLLSDLLIRRGEGVTSTTRRVGPELSKRLYLLMHSRDPEHILDAGL
uniref:Essential meiotic structure-specific endonuclease 1 n=1 Tax=Fundulus heteroclitus TaxID=8078 RepID=A0A3Q2QDN9_FUNHE